MKPDSQTQTQTPATQTVVMPILDDAARFALHKAGQKIRFVDDRMELNTDPYSIPDSIRAVTKLHDEGQSFTPYYCLLEYKSYSVHPWNGFTEPVTRKRPEWAGLPDWIFNAQGVAVVGDLMVVAMDERRYKAIKEAELEQGRKRIGTMQQRGPDGRPWTGDRPIVHERDEGNVGINMRPVHGQLPVRA